MHSVTRFRLRYVNVMLTLLLQTRLLESLSPEVLKWAAENLLSLSTSQSVQKVLEDSQPLSDEYKDVASVALAELESDPIKFATFRDRLREEQPALHAEVYESKNAVTT